MHGPVLSAFASRATLAAVPTNLISLRGGASLGPIDADTALVVSLLGTALYALEMLAWAWTQPCKKYFGTPESPMSIWFGYAMAMYAGAIGYAKIGMNACSTGLLKICSVGWLAAVALMLYQLNNKTFKTQQSLYVAVPIALIVTYCAFA
ncbi:hypothetical protein T492DRAFT_899987 [Pavlovales sp. CCMP2436]|nr:hypothetical protein T492DRAFT_899987 [Pavlovales sp. CCMP2436]|mmetsp:Transcript_19030/g.44814  ORF Transcript_19030/g.44814 Transcript_19030/m.44814 type:complete len:150 (-) Transcript_19030:181-630(-)